MKITNMKKYNRIVIGLLCAIFLGIVLGMVAFICMPSDSFVTTFYTMHSSKMEAPIRIVHLSDIHNKEYGEANIHLIEETASMEPDLIFITGDSVSGDHEDISPAIDLVEQLVSIAPVYYVYGNHEDLNDYEFNRNIGELFAKAGAHVLDFSYEDVTIDGQELRIGGLYGLCFPEKFLETGEGSREEVDFLKEFQDTQRHTMLLTHLPVCWLEHDGLEEWDIDSVFSGHSHGGQFVLPVLGPVYAPDQGLFPDRVAGLFTSLDGTSQMVVSRGLGDSVKLPRINNDPELVVVDVVPE